MKLTILIAVAAILTLLIPAALVYVGFCIDRTVDKLHSSVEMAIHGYINRHGRKQRFLVGIALFYKQTGSRLQVTLVTCALFIQLYLVYVMFRTVNILEYIASVLCTIAASIFVAMLIFRKSPLYKWFYTSPVARGVWIIISITAVWFARAVTSAQLGDYFGAASLHLTAALNAGTFIRAVGLLSIALSMPVLLLECSFFFALHDVMGLSKRFCMKWRRRRSVVALFLGFMCVSFGFNAAFIPATNVERVGVLLSDIAYTFDLWPEFACTGITLPSGSALSDKRQILFRNTSATEAMVFQIGTPSSTPVRRWTEEESRSARMKFVGLMNCPLGADAQPTAAGR